LNESPENDSSDDDSSDDDSSDESHDEAPEDETFVEDQPTTITIDDDEDDVADDPNETYVVRDDEMEDPSYVPAESFAEETLPSQPAQGTRSKVRTLNPFNFTNFGFFTAEPSCLEEAKNNKNWKRAMEEEMSAHAINQTWSIQPLPPGRKTVKCKWVFKTKMNEAREVSRHKARLVAKGFSQIKGIDYTKTFAPVVRFTSIRCLMALAVKKRMLVHQMDAVTAFLQGELTEEIYMDQPEGFEDGTDRVCRLKKTIYGLKQAGREWNSKLDAALIRYGLSKSKMDPCIYYLKNSCVISCLDVSNFTDIFAKDKTFQRI
jgi:Reverse transcriptase (RNA-dependent DNA polymerase)